MSEDRETLPPRPKPEEKSKGRLLDWLDAIAKLVGAAAVLAVALIANSFQGRLTGVSIQSQREQAESQLRANMFSSLIGPIAGPQTNGKALWTHVYEVAYEDWAFDPKQEIGPVATPIVQNGKVYTVGRLGHLFCLDARKGEVLWPSRAAVR